MFSAKLLLSDEDEQLFDWLKDVKRGRKWALFLKQKRAICGSHRLQVFFVGNTSRRDFFANQASYKLGFAQMYD